jgi:hypothetical protein
VHYTAVVIGAYIVTAVKHHIVEAEEYTVAARHIVTVEVYTAAKRHTVTVEAYTAATQHTIITAREYIAAAAAYHIVTAKEAVDRVYPAPRIAVRAHLYSLYLP